MSQKEYIFILKYRRLIYFILNMLQNANRFKNKK